MHRETVNNINFLYITNSKNVNDQISFWPIFVQFPSFLGQFFLSRISNCHAQLHMGFLHHAKILKKLLSQFNDNACTVRQTLLYRNLPATATGPRIRSLHSLTSNISASQNTVYYVILTSRLWLIFTFKNITGIKFLTNNNYINLWKRKGFLEQIKQHENACELLLCMKKKKNSYISISIIKSIKNATPSAANISKRQVIIGHLLCFTNHLLIYLLLSIYYLGLTIKVVWNKTVLSWFCV